MTTQNDGRALRVPGDHLVRRDIPYKGVKTYKRIQRHHCGRYGVYETIQASVPTILGNNYQCALAKLSNLIPKNSERVEVVAPVSGRIVCESLLLYVFVFAQHFTFSSAIAVLLFNCSALQLNTLKTPAQMTWSPG